MEIFNLKGKEFQFLILEHRLRTHSNLAVFLWDDPNQDQWAEITLII